MGALTASGSFARVMGPVMVTYIYNYLGVYATIGTIEVLMVVAMITTIIFWKRLVPFAQTPAGRAMGLASGAVGTGQSQESGYDAGPVTFGDMHSVSSDNRSTIDIKFDEE